MSLDTSRLPTGSVYLTMADGVGRRDMIAEMEARIERFVNDPQYVATEERLLGHLRRVATAD